MPVKDADTKCTACEPKPEAILVLAPLGERAPRILAAVQLAVLGLDRARALLCSAHDQLLAGGAATHRALQRSALLAVALSTATLPTWAASLASRDFLPLCGGQ